MEVRAPGDEISREGIASRNPARNRRTKRENMNIWQLSPSTLSLLIASLPHHKSLATDSGFVFSAAPRRTQRPKANSGCVCRPHRNEARAVLQGFPNAAASGIVVSLLVFISFPRIISFYSFFPAVHFLLYHNSTWESLGGLSNWLGRYRLGL